jgi:hypothetical protein
LRYQVFSYGNPSEPRRNQRDHGGIADRADAEQLCRTLVCDSGRRSAHVMRDDDTIVYYFDQEELTHCSRGELNASDVLNPDLAERILRKATPDASRLLRALIDEGGTATAEKLKALTDTTKLGPKVLGNTAGRYFRVPFHDDNWRLVESYRRAGLNVYEYTVLQKEQIPVFEQALRRLGR